MKEFLILFLFLPIFSFSKERSKLPNPCDSLSKVVYLPGDHSVPEISITILKVFRVYKVHKDDLIHVEQVNDSTFIGSGVFYFDKMPSIKEDDVFGKYFINYLSAGKVTFKFIVDLKPGKYRYEFYDLIHEGVVMNFGSFCNRTIDEHPVNVNGLKVMFYRRVAEINSLVSKAFSKREW